LGYFVGGCFHPHIHALGLYGALDEQGNFRQLESVELEYLIRCFRDNVLDALLQEGLIEQETVTAMQGWENSGFNVFVGEPVAAADADARQFLARYLKKSPVALARLELIETGGGDPALRFVPPAGHMVRITSTAKGESKILDPLDFLAELQQHIPDIFEQTVRFLGVNSSRTRGAKRLALDTPGPLPVADPPARPSSQWARCIKKVYLADPLICKKCGGKMHIKSFVHDQKEITRLSKNLGLCPGPAPPAIIVSSLRHAA
jgi:hypothetical protein